MDVIEAMYYYNGGFVHCCHWRALRPLGWSVVKRGSISWAALYNSIHYRMGLKRNMVSAAPASPIV